MVSARCFWALLCVVPGVRDLLFRVSDLSGVRR